MLLVLYINKQTFCPITSFLSDTDLLNPPSLFWTVSTVLQTKCFYDRLTIWHIHRSKLYYVKKKNPVKNGVVIDYALIFHLFRNFIDMPIIIEEIQALIIHLWVYSNSEFFAPSKLSLKKLCTSDQMKFYQHQID